MVRVPESRRSQMFAEFAGGNRDEVTTFPEAALRISARRITKAGFRRILKSKYHKCPSVTVYPALTGIQIRRRIKENEAAVFELTPPNQSRRPSCHPEKLRCPT